MDTASHTDRSGLAGHLQGILATRALDLGLVRQMRELPEEQRRAIVEWQRTARVYELIQQVARRRLALGDLPGESRDLVWRTMFNLNLAIERSIMPADLVLYRGIRSLRNTYDAEDPADLCGQTRRELGYFAGSVYADVALRDFTTPKGALIVMRVPKGTPALWVARAGNPRLSWQGEVLLQPHTATHIRFVNEQSQIPVLSAQVMR